jgi:hypothetical protein
VLFLDRGAYLLALPRGSRVAEVEGGVDADAGYLQPRSIMGTHICDEMQQRHVRTARFAAYSLVVTCVVIRVKRAVMAMRAVSVVSVAEPQQPHTLRSSIFTSVLTTPRLFVRSFSFC